MALNGLGDFLPYEQLLLKVLKQLRNINILVMVLTQHFKFRLKITIFLHLKTEFFRNHQNVLQSQKLE